eukprot:CAMPEP_0173443760 /NCGR_PEP_ID=MMETSP1357-20121228/30677_1 /TAXON_ID=77926 /ORGANISM="Hemiselmis rufescens, Strain PCC563" /LENGTH=55 /DNA_ID=CAMNT_0014409713 /DNA_START=107 /DNA_END=271 /DNA_ORIENTATION=-
MKGDSVRRAQPCKNPRSNNQFGAMPLMAGGLDEANAQRLMAKYGIGNNANPNMRV